MSHDEGGDADLTLRAAIKEPMVILALVLLVAILLLWIFGGSLPG